MSTLYTIGHSNGGIEPFVSALHEHAVTLLIDVRSKPRSRFAQFNGRPLQAHLRDAGIDYAYMGDQLGGMPRDPSWATRWKQGGVDPTVIDHLRSTEHWRDGIAALASIVSKNDATCIMCSEREPANCHRAAVAEDVAAAVPALAITHVVAARPAPAQQRLL